MFFRSKDNTSHRQFFCLLMNTLFPEIWHLIHCHYYFKFQVKDTEAVQATLYCKTNEVKRDTRTNNTRKVLVKFLNDFCSLSLGYYQPVLFVFVLTLHLMATV